MIRYDYTIVEGPRQDPCTRDLAPDGFIAIDAFDEDGEVTQRVCDVYGTGELSQAIANGVLVILEERTGHPAARVFP